MLQWKHELSTTLNQITPNCHYFLSKGSCQSCPRRSIKPNLGWSFLVKHDSMLHCPVEPAASTCESHHNTMTSTTPWAWRAFRGPSWVWGLKIWESWTRGQMCKKPVKRWTFRTPKSTSSWSSSLRTAKKFIGPPWTISRSSCILSGRTMEPCHFRRHICSSF